MSMPPLIVPNNGENIQIELMIKKLTRRCFYHSRPRWIALILATNGKFGLRQ
jgi:hypothetical protein